MPHSIAPSPAPSASSVADLAGRYLTFCLGAEEYALPILTVREMIAVQTITPVPRTEPYLRGVINLRGKIVPVLDLRRRLEMEPRDPTPESCIVILEAHGVEMGMLVDAVRDVQDIPPEALSEPPSFGAALATHYLLGIGRCAGRVQLLIDIDRVMSFVDATAAREAAQTAGGEAA